MKGWKFIIVGAAAMAALAIGMGAQAAPQADDLQLLINMLSNPLG
jgi:hypothetical protein